DDLVLAQRPVVGDVEEVPEVSDDAELAALFLDELAEHNDAAGGFGPSWAEIELRGVLGEQSLVEVSTLLNELLLDARLLRARLLDARLLRARLLRARLLRARLLRARLLRARLLRARLLRARLLRARLLRACPRTARWPCERAPRSLRVQVFCTIHEGRVGV